MNGKTFERELPNGYKLAKCFDMKKNPWFALKIFFLSLICYFISFVPPIILLMIFKTDKIEDFMDSYSVEMWISVLVVFIIYIILHELEHGRVYKKLTGEKLTYGVNPLCAYCGVPNIFTYRKTALAAVVAPFRLYSILFFVPLVITFFVAPGICLGLTVLFSIHISGCSGDLYVMWLLLKKYTDDTVLINDIGPVISIFVYDTNATYEDEEKARAHMKSVLYKPTDEEKKKKRINTAKKSSASLTVICAIGAIFSGIITFQSVFSDVKFRIEEPKIYDYMSFWLTLIFVGIIAVTALTFKKLAKTKICISVMCILLMFPLLFLSALFSASFDEFYTNDINNYGIYNYSDDWNPPLFPEEITEDMTPIYYSYYHSSIWDSVLEVYFEVEMTENAYSSLKSQYTDQLKEFWFDSDFYEYAESDRFTVFGNNNYCDLPHVKKILFNDNTRTVIFVYMNGLDPLYFENIYFFERFNIDGHEYSDHLKELKNEGN